jgi:AcrR family transcriptional regulator
MSTNTKPPLAAQSTDLRARRTRAWQQNALAKLMKEKPFGDIQVTEITERAQVSRQAFYLHFHSKEELLLSQVDVIFNEFHAVMTREIARGALNRKNFSILLFTHWENHSDTLRMVIAADQPDIFMGRLKIHMRAILTELENRTRRHTADPRVKNLVEGFLAGGAYMLLTEWVAQEAPFTGEQMGLLFYDLTSRCSSSMMGEIGACGV